MKRHLTLALLLAACGATIEDGSDPNGPDDPAAQRAANDNGAPGDEDPNNAAQAGNNDVVVSPNNAAPGNNAAPNNNLSPDAVSLASFYDAFFPASGCTSGYCHGAFGLSSSADVYAAFVNVEAAEPTCGRTHYVVPGDPEQSILWLKIRDTEDEDIECGVTKMPKERSEPLDPELVGMIYDWIATGAAP